MSDVASPSFQLPDLGEESPQQSIISSSDVFSLHVSYYRDLFLLRTPITINGCPAVIKEGEGERPAYLYHSEPQMELKLELSKFSSLAAKKLVPHGVYHIDTYFYEQVPLLSVVFQSQTRLKQFLMKADVIKSELEKVFAEEIRNSVVRRHSSSQESLSVQIEIESKLFLASPDISASDQKHGVKIQEVTLDNYVHYATTWQQSKVFDFSQSLFDIEASSQQDNTGRSICITISKL